MPFPVIWAELDADDYQQKLDDLNQWVRWLVQTYRVNESMIPPCWYRHPDLLEDLTHLWLGWQQAHHPQMGMGRTGMDWDVGRDSCLARMRIMVGGSCSTTKGHVPTAAPPLPPWVEPDFGDHSTAEHSSRRHDGVRRARRAAAREILQDSDTVVRIYIDRILAADPDPTNPTPECRRAAEAAVTAALNDVATAAAEAAQVAGRSIWMEDHRMDAEHRATRTTDELSERLGQHPTGSPPYPKDDPGTNVVSCWIADKLAVADHAVMVNRSIAAAKHAARSAGREAADPSVERSVRSNSDSMESTPRSARTNQRGGANAPPNRPQAG